MYKKSFSILAVFLMLFSNSFSFVAKANNNEEKTAETATLYLISGDDEEKLLSPDKGLEAKDDVIKHTDELKNIVYTMENINGEYNGTGKTNVDLYLNGLGVGVGPIVKVYYDFNGDGSWDRTEISDVLATDGNLDDYELFKTELKIDGEGKEYANFTNGRMMVEVLIGFGEHDVQVKVNDPEEASKIMIPYNIVGEEGEQDPSKEEGNENSGENPGNDDNPGENENPGDVENPGDNDGSKDEDPSENEENPGDDEDSDEGEQPGDSEIEVPNDPNWTLTWEDNFDGGQLDESKWTIDLGNGYLEENGTWQPGWGNNELQYYHENNVSLEDGKLILKGKKETITDERGTYQYTSGKIHTRGKFNQKYGKFEAKMKLPKGQGYWPAFWMMPEDDVYGTWAASGEIDIMEAAGGNPNRVGGALHYGGQWPNNTHTAADYHFEDGRDITDFNIYSIEWEPGEIRWYVNGHLYQKLNNWSSTDAGNSVKYSYPAPFDQEFFVIFNLAIGGWYGGGPDDSTTFPGQVEVDYVRAYELTGRDYLKPKEPGFDKEELPSDAKKAIDGNYVYDPTFENGFTTIATNKDKWDTDYWNLVYLDEFNGKATASVDRLGDQPFAKVDIQASGNQSHSVQLIQNVTVGKGRWYKLSFDAKSSANRNISVKIGGGEDRGWTAYSPNRDFSLSNEVQSYEMTFQMQHDSDALARLEFNMGLNANPVWIGNIVLEEMDNEDPYNEQAPKKPMKNGNHVYNGTFDQGRMDRMTYWNFVTDKAEAKASVDPNKRELEIAITDGGNNEQAIQVLQKGINLLSNDEYQLTFKARATTDRNIKAALISEDGKVTYADKDINLSTTMEEKTLNFTMPAVTDTNGQLVFYVGGNNHSVFLDDVKMIRLTNHNQEQLSLNDIFPLKNGDFSNELTHWGKHVQGEFDHSGSSATLQSEDGRAKMSVTNVGSNPWDVMFMQEGLELQQGQTYVVEFDAKSSIDRTIEVIVENASYTRFLSEEIQLTNEMNTFNFEFKMNENETTGLKYLLGKIDGAPELTEAHDVFIDNVRLEIKGEREKAFPLKNGDYSNDLTDWDKHVQGEFDGDSSATVEVINGEAKVAVENVGENAWDVQLFQSDLTLNKDRTYIVEFDAKSTIDRKLEVILENPAYNRYFEKVVSLTDAMETYSFEFTMSEDDLVALKFLLGNVENEGITSAHDIFIDNVRLELKGAKEALAGDGDDGGSTDPDPENPDPVDPEPENPDPVDPDPEPENPDPTAPDINDEIQELKKEIEKLLDQIKDLDNRKQLEKLEQRIQDLEKEIAELIKKVEAPELLKQIEQMKEQIKVLTDQITELKKSLDPKDDNQGDENNENKDKDGDKDTNNNDDKDDDGDVNIGSENNNKNNGGKLVEGETLPNTATANYNILIGGLVILFLGTAILLIRRKNINNI